MMYITLPKSEIAGFQKKLNSLNKRGQKIGGHLQIVSTEEQIETREIAPGRTVKITMVVLSIEGTVPRVNGYELVCRVEHTEKGNILTEITGAVVGWRDAEPHCQHCHSKRRRKDTFFVRNVETGDVLQVGRSCLADYVRSEDIKAVVSWFHGFEKLGERACVVDSRCYDPSTEELLQCACAAVRQDGGYFPRGTEKGSTLGHALWIYFPPSSANEGIYREWCAAQPTNEDVEKSSSILEWIASVDTAQSYFHNLHVVCSLEGVSSRNQGILVSAVQAYDRAQGQAKKVQYDMVEKVSSYVGTVGGKINSWSVTVDKIIPFDGTYGVTFFILMTDESGNKFKWTASKRPCVNEGDTATLNGRIKSHNEYRGMKQTVVTRCSLAVASGK